MTVPDPQRDNPRTNVAGLAPHALIADFRDLADRGRTGRNDGDPVGHDIRCDLHLKALADAKLFLFGRQLFAQDQRNLGAGAQNVLLDGWLEDSDLRGLDRSRLDGGSGCNRCRCRLSIGWDDKKRGEPAEYI